MKTRSVEELARAVLYEGYLLYPYRMSSAKNRHRWNFGVLYPQDYILSHNSSDAYLMQTECLAVASPNVSIDVSIRFLHLRSAHQITARPSSVTEQVNRRSPLFNDNQCERWEEAQHDADERRVVVSNLTPGEFVSGPKYASFLFPDDGSHKRLDKDELTKSREAPQTRYKTITGSLETLITEVESGVFKVHIRVSNVSQLEKPESEGRDELLTQSLLSTQMVLNIQNGGFVSLLDPPEHLKPAAASCANIGAYPVLAGDGGSHDTVLAAPIILYDYPEIAAESPGDLFDSTEIDEILSLRILTLTDEEKLEVRQGDKRAREILERTEMLPPEHMMKLHGAIRGLRRVTEAEHE